MLTKELQDVVAMLVQKEQKLRADAEGFKFRHQKTSRLTAANALADARHAIESGEYIGVSKESAGGNVVTFTIPPAPGARFRAVREIRNVLNIPLAWAKSYADAGSVECPSDEQAAELAERLKSAGIFNVQIGASKEASNADRG